MQALHHRLQVVFAIIILSLSSAFSQSEQAAALHKLYATYPQEKIYLWLNKPEYLAGETAWFKVYVFSGYELSNISTNVYVELYDSGRKLIVSRLLPLLDGVGQGSLDLADKLPEGIYYIRAYTRWMMNFDESYQFIHTLPVINPASATQLIQKKKEWTAKAFPEGGQLVNGLKTKMAVRLFSSAILPDQWSGYVYEEGNPGFKIAEFTALDKNVASFYFTPEDGKKYAATITDDAGTSQTIPFPEVKKSGVGIRVENHDDSIVCKLNFKTLSADGQSYRLVGQMQHQMVYHADFTNTGATLKMTIATPEMYNGILHLTLFDNEKNVMAERLVFVNPGKLFIDSMALGSLNLSGQPRAKSEVEIVVDSLSWASYAIAVSDAEAPFSASSQNLLSTLWLTSDLEKPVHDAAGFFNGQNKNAAEALDALLITEKWKRFRWDDILNNRFTTIRYLPHPYLSYTGTVKRNRRLLPLQEITLILYAPDSSRYIGLVKPDNSGSFLIDNLAFEGEVKAFYQENSKKSNAKNIDIDFERNNKSFPYSLPFPESNYILVPRSKTDSVPAWVLSSINDLKNEKSVNNQYKTLQEVIVRSKLKTDKEQLIEKLGANRFSSFNETVFDFINEEQHALAYSNILQWLDGRVAGLDVVLENGVYVPYIRGSAASVFLDEMPYPADALNNISISDIALVKVVKGPMAFAFGGGGGGSIIIYTARGDLRPRQKMPSLNHSTMIGYDEEKKFPIPDYNDKFIKQPEKDTRSQLLWSSLLLPDKSLTLSTKKFVNNDSPKRFRVVIQGFTQKGFPVYVEKIIGPAVKAF